MPATSDELAVRAALEELTAAQPAAPVDRLDRIRRRYRRRRAWQAAAAGVAAAAVVAGVVLGATLAGGASRADLARRPLPGWALPWPLQRDASVPQSRLDDAFATWRQQDGSGTDPMFAPRRVIWYLAAPVADRSATAVVFEVERDDGEHRLVAGWRRIDTSPDDNNGWILYDVPAPDPHRDPVVSFYVDQANGAGAPHNWVVALTAPGRAPLAMRTSAGIVGRTSPSRYTEVDAGVLREQVRIEAHGVVGLVGAPDSQAPDLEHPSLAGIPSAPALGDVWGQGPVTSDDSSSTARGHVVVYARCYAADGSRQSLSVAVDRANAPRVTVPCDGRQHEATGAYVVPGHTDLGGGPERHGSGHALYVYASQLVSYEVAVDIR